LSTPSLHIEITRSKPDHLGKPLFGASYGQYFDFRGNVTMNFASFGQCLGRCCFAFIRWAMKLLRVVRPGGLRGLIMRSGHGQKTLREKPCIFLNRKLSLVPNISFKKDLCDNRARKKFINMGRGADNLMGFRRGRRGARFTDRVSPKGTFVIGLRGFVIEFFFCCPN
jgi:hypothetical protein